MIPAEVRALFERLHSEPRRIVFPGPLPGRNELDESQRKFHTNAAGYRVPLYAQIKSTWNGALRGRASRYAGLWPAYTGRALIACNWREPDKKRDPDNIVSGGRKLLLDALGPGRKGERGWKGAGLLHCDGWHCIAGFLDLVTIDAGAPGVEVIVAPLQLALPLSRHHREAIVDLRGEGT